MWIEATTIAEKAGLCDKPGEIPMVFSIHSNNESNKHSDADPVSYSPDS